MWAAAAHVDGANNTSALVEITYHQNVTRGVSCLLALQLTACGFTLSAPAGNDLGDAPLPDAGECVMAGQTCAGPRTLRTCGDRGPAVDTTCAWACTTGVPDHCGVFIPTGGALTKDDLDPTGLMDVTVGPATITTDTGNVMGTVSGTFDFKMVNNIAVLRAKSIRFTGPVMLRGSRAIAFAADGEIVVGAVLDARGSCASTFAGPGGSPGGPFLMAGHGPGGGGAGPDSEGAGAGGGGYGAQGGRGGNGDGIPGLGGTTYGDTSLATLIGGSGGGGGGGGGGNVVGVGGGGGGAIQLASNTSIQIGPSGVINAGGCGGKGANSDANDGGGGGGSGGAILLEAPVVDVLGALAVNGGGGGASKDFAGGDGPSGRIAASGGIGTVNGGPGGFATTLVGVMGATNTAVGGGGGGGVGRIRVNTRDSIVNVPGATMSPGFNDVPTTATRSTANVQ